MKKNRMHRKLRDAIAKPGLFAANRGAQENGLFASGDGVV